MLYCQSMHKNFEDKEKKKHNSNLNRFFHFFNFCFLVESHYLDHPSFKQLFFHKNFFSFLFYHFQHGIFFISSFLFQTCQFFCSTLKNIFFEGTHFFDFSSFIQNKTSSYFEKKTEWETIFFIFFLKFKTHFLYWQESIFLNLNNAIKFINKKTRSFLFYKKSQHTCICFIMNLQKEIREQKCLFTYPKFG